MQSGQGCAAGCAQLVRGSNQTSVSPWGAIPDKGLNGNATFNPGAIAMAVSGGAHPTCWTNLVRARCRESSRRAATRRASPQAQGSIHGDAIVESATSCRVAIAGAELATRRIEKCGNVAQQVPPRTIVGFPSLILPLTNVSRHIDPTAVPSNLSSSDSTRGARPPCRGAEQCRLTSHDPVRFTPRIYHPKCSITAARRQRRLDRMHEVRADGAWHWQL
jgi:hypothetical protein